jgi:hypothetical protein
MLNEQGILLGAWQYDNSNPRDKIYPYLVKKRGATEKTFDVSLSGSSSDYRGVCQAEFIRKLKAEFYPSSATIRMRSLSASGSKGSGWLIRNIVADPSL